MVDSPGAMIKVSAVPEIKPLNQYDFSRAKICASVRWLLSKSYGSAGTALRAAAWVGRAIIIIIIRNVQFRGSIEAAGSVLMQRPSMLRVGDADEKPIIVTMSWMLVAGISTLRDA